MKEKIAKLLQKTTEFTQMRYIRIITNAFISIAAISIAGSIFSLLKSLPIQPWLNFLQVTGIDSLLSVPIAIANDLMAIYVCLAVSYQTAKEFKQDPFSAAVIALGAFMILTPFVGMSYDVDPATGNYIINTMQNVIPIDNVGARGIFLGILCGLLATRLYCFLLEKKVSIKLPDSVPSNVSKMFESMVPGGVVYLIFLVARYGVSLTTYGTFQNLIYKLLQAPLVAVGGGLAGCLIYIIAGKFFWFFGVHGGMVTYSAMAVIIRTASAANQSAFAVGEAAPFPEWALTMSSWCELGILSLVLLMIFLSKSQRYKSLGKIAFPSALFGIGEPVMFGAPLVYNFTLFIPYMLSAPLTFLLTYGAMKIGILASPTGAAVSAFLPDVIKGVLLTKSWFAVIWTLLMIAFNLALYYPFFKAIDRKALEEENTKEVSE